MASVAGPMIAEEIVELGERARNVLVIMTINNLNPLRGVGVIKQQEMIPALTRRRLLRGRRARLSTRAARRNQQQHGARDPETPRSLSRCVHIFSSDVVLAHAGVAPDSPGPCKMR
jgi:hypothetical protein